jgi:SAM-dependent methyltransferase
MTARRLANDEVLAFYRALPFNYKESVESAAAMVRRQGTPYPPLVPYLRRGTTVLDVGCGAGWHTHALALHHGCAVTGIDYNPVAIARAAAVARALSIEARYHVADLFEFVPEQPFDVVMSVGVLHHTNDCLEGVRRVAGFVKEGGRLLLGLYHRHGRKPFREHFDALKARGATDEALFAEYRRLHSALRDDVLARSWFRDQVLHPHETQHTLREIVPVLGGEGMTLVSASTNNFAPFSSPEALYELEPGFEDLARKRLAEGAYFPGFFVALFTRLPATRTTTPHAMKGAYA